MKMEIICRVIKESQSLHTWPETVKYKTLEKCSSGVHEGPAREKCSSGVHEGPAQEKCSSGVHEGPEESVEKAESATLQTTRDQQTSPRKISNAYFFTPLII